jgi:hypothetical protein
VRKLSPVEHGSCRRNILVELPDAAGSKTPQTKHNKETFARNHFHRC